MPNTYYTVLVRVGRDWLYITGVKPITLTPSKLAYKFATNKDAQECAERFSEAIIEVVQDSQS